jgi:hypothetical protein
VFGLTGDERALLYRFAFETGIRPGQIRALVVKDFDLDSDPPTLTTHARFVKKRKAHTQALRPSLAADLRERFKSKMPTAAAFKMPDEYKLARMLRTDLATARQAWVDTEGLSREEREKRHRSDFLCDVNHQGERAVFYSTRHGHGTALAEAGVPEKDIAASMHHSNRSTTARYLHSDRRAVNAAIGAMPDLFYSQRQRAVATGTNGPEPEPVSNAACAAACASQRSSVESGGESDSAAGACGDARRPENPGVSALAAVECNSGSVAQRLEQGTHNPLVLGSNPSAPNPL